MKSTIFLKCNRVSVVRLIISALLNYTINYSEGSPVYENKVQGMYRVSQIFSIDCEESNGNLGLCGYK